MTVVGLLASARVFAHHGANLYDMTKAIELKGTVAKFYWGNPHNEVAIDVTDASGKVVQWVAYTEPPLVMLERGWTRKSIPVGEKVNDVHLRRQEWLERRHAEQNRAAERDRVDRI